MQFSSLRSLLLGWLSEHIFTGARTEKPLSEPSGSDSKTPIFEKPTAPSTPLTQKRALRSMKKRRLFPKSPRVTRKG